MTGHGMPNDVMQNFDPISILVVIPILDRLVYPLLRKMNIELKPIRRITIGFVLAGLCLAYAAIVQHIIYQAGPCYGEPLHCDAATQGDHAIPNNVHIAIQTPAYFLIGASEVFISGKSCIVYLEFLTLTCDSVTGLEYAYVKPIQPLGTVKTITNYHTHLF